MSKAKLSATDWELVKDAPFWVNAALAAADGRVALLVKRKEAKALNAAMESYKGKNQLVRDVIANDDDPDKAVEKASKDDAEKALGRISGIIERQLSVEDLDEFSAFLLSVGRSVAESAGEGVLGIGKNTSDEESEALQGIANALKATPAHKQARRQAKQAAEQAAREEAAEAKAVAAAKAKADAEAAAAAKAKVEAASKAKAEAEAKAEAAAKAKAEAERKAKLEAQEQKREEALEARKQERAQEKAEREAEAKAAEEAAAEAAKQKAASKSRFTEFIAEHKVVSGENLSVISQKYYNTQANFRLIYEANQEIIGDNPNLIRVGQVLKIPKL